MSVTVIVGEQRGDEGKGRFVDMLAEEHDIVARFNGGNNAGHTVVTDDGRELALHGIPSGIAYDHTMNITGRGCLINAVALGKEAETVRAAGFEVSENNLMISSGAHLILPHHISIDQIREAGAGKQGSTQSGIAPAASAKYMREGLRAEIINNDLGILFNTIRDGLLEQREKRKQLDLTDIDPDETAELYTEKARELSPYVTDTDIFLHKQLSRRDPAKVLAEGAQAFWLDIDHGMWPFVTSSSTTAGGVANGLGIPPHHITQVVGVSKLIQSHVGGGPFVTEVENSALLAQLHGDKTTVDAECGTTTGRERRLGYLDIPAIRRSQMVNGTTEMAITKLDWVPRFGATALICTSYTRKGKKLDIAPDAAYKLEQSQPNYVELPTWTEDIQGVRTFDDLPEAAQNYVSFIETQAGTPITMIGVGPGRDQVIDRRNEVR